jgi:hypothetical protein
VAAKPSNKTVEMAAVDMVSIIRGMIVSTISRSAALTT